MNAANTVRLEIEYHDSGAMGPIDLSCSVQGLSSLGGLIRDFKDSHPDFQHIIGDDDGIVKSDLGDGNGAEIDNPAYAQMRKKKIIRSRYYTIRFACNKRCFAAI